MKAMTNSEKIISFAKNNWLIAIIVITVLAIIYFGSSYLLDNYRESRFDRERDALLKKASEHEQSALEWKVRASEAEKNEQKLADYNLVLKAINERQAEMLEASDIKRLEKESANLEKAKEELAGKLTAIENTSPENQRDELCKDGKDIGVTFSFCK
jgi:hypothetical protein